MNYIKKSQIDYSFSQFEQKILRYWNNGANLEIERVKEVYLEKSQKKL